MTFSVPLFCESCKKPMTVVAATNSEVRTVRAEWECPWCQRLNSERVAGRIVAVLVGHGAVAPNSVSAGEARGRRIAARHQPSRPRS